MLNYVERFSSNYKNVILYGQSLGGYYLLQTLPLHPQLKIDLLVLDSTFASYWNLIKAKMGIKLTGNVKRKILTPTLIISGKPRW